MGTAIIDMNRGETLKEKVEARRNELEDALAREDLLERTRMDVRAALDSLGLIVGAADLEDPPAMTVAQLTDWLEKTAHVVDGEPMAPPPMGSEPNRPEHV